MRRIILFFCLLALPLSLVSCKKAVKTKIAEFVQAFNNTAQDLTGAGMNITYISAEKTGENEVTIRTYLDFLKDDSEMEMMASPVLELMANALKTEPQFIDLIEEGVDFKLKIVDKNSQLVETKVYNKANIGSLKMDMSSMDMSSPDDLNKVLETFNKALPPEDPETGLKILKIRAGQDHDIIYEAQISDSYAEIFSIEGSEDIIKEETIKDPQIGRVLNSVEKFNINTLKYQYKDPNGKLIKEIVITKNDLK